MQILEASLLSGILTHTFHKMISYETHQKINWNFLSKVFYCIHTNLHPESLKSSLNGIQYFCGLDCKNNLRAISFSLDLIALKNFRLVFF